MPTTISTPPFGPITPIPVGAIPIPAGGSSGGGGGSSGSGSGSGGSSGSVELFIDYLDHSGASVGSFAGLKPTWGYKLSEPGTCSWALALSQTQRNSTSPITQDMFAPKRNDYLLWADDGFQQIDLQSGRLLTVNLESDTGLIQCSGKDWLEYLDQPFPHDYSITPQTMATQLDEVFAVFVATGGVDTANVKYNSTQQKIIQFILTRANALSDITYVPNFQGSGWGEVLEYEFQFLDSTSMLSHIQAVSTYADPLGFDFWCDTDKTIFFYSPRLTQPSSVVTILDFVYGIDPVVKVVWNDTGPKATDTVGKNSINLWKKRSYPPSVSAFREELEIIELGQKFDFARTDTILQHQINVATDAVGSNDWNPQKDLTLTVLPDKLFPTSALAGYVSMVGNAVSFDSAGEFLPFHRINATYWIISQDYHTDDDSGNYVLDLGLQQIYAT